MLKWLISLVFPGVCETFARLFLSVSILIRDDFPTFERPIKANSGRSVFGHCFRSVLLEINVEEIIFIFRLYKETSKRLMIC